MINQTYKIDPASDSDSKTISELIFAIWQQEYAFKVLEGDFPDLKSVQSYYSQRQGAFYVARDQDRIVGTIAYEGLGKNQFVLKRMFVHKDYRGHGIAQGLLDSVLTHLPKESSLFLSTKEDLALAAKAFYLKNGFEIISSQSLPQGFPLFYEDDLFMKKDV